MKAGYVAASFIGLAVLCLLAVGGFKFWKFVSGDQQVIDIIKLLSSP